MNVNICYFPIFVTIFMKFSPKSKVKVLGIKYTILVSFNAFLIWEAAEFLAPDLAQDSSNLSSHTRKMRVKKAISEVVFSLLAFSREWKFCAVIRGSYPRYKSSLEFP